MYRWSVFAGAAASKRVRECSLRLSNFFVGFAFCCGFLFSVPIVDLMVISFNTLTTISVFFVCILLLIHLNIIWHNLSLLELIFLKFLMNYYCCLSFTLRQAQPFLLTCSTSSHQRFLARKRSTIVKKSPIQRIHCTIIQSRNKI